MEISSYSDERFRERGFGENKPALSRLPKGSTPGPGLALVSANWRSFWTAPALWRFLATCAPSQQRQRTAAFQDAAAQPEATADPNPEFRQELFHASAPRREPIRTVTR